MNFPAVIYGVTFLAGFVTALCALPIWRKWCLRANLIDDPGQRKIHERPIPLAGGLTVMTALAFPSLVAVAVIGFHPRLPGHDTVQLLTYGLSRRGIELAAILLGAFGMLIVGLLDDRHELRPSVKFAGQLAVAFLVAAAKARITLFVHSPVFHYAITMLWILTVINAFNFMDNMNGLCGGLGAIGAFFFAMIAAVAGQYLVALIGFLACGALIGFLPYNFPRATAFLGDSGSHLVGYLLAILAILPHFYTRHNPRALAVLSPLLVLAVPLADLVRVVLLRSSRGKPFYIGDTNHLSHWLVRIGCSRVQAVLLIWLIAAALGTLALLWQI